MAAADVRACVPMSIDARLEKVDLPSWTGTTGMRPQLQISTMLWSGSCRKIWGEGKLVGIEKRRERGEEKMRWKKTRL